MLNPITYYMKELKNRSLYRLSLLSNASLCLSVLIFVLLSLTFARQAEESLAGDLAPQVLRFHVLANSDSGEDQKLKMEVKGLLINTIYQDLSAQVKSCQGYPASETQELSKETLISYIKENKGELEAAAEAYMQSRGYSYPADIRIEQCYFPTRLYGDVAFPCGTYDAVRVLLGNGSGKNWWCVLYPPLCFTDNAMGQVPDSSKKELKNLLDEDDYHLLMENRRVMFGAKVVKEAKDPGAPAVTVRVKFRFLELLGNGGRAD